MLDRSGQWQLDKRWIWTATVGLLLFLLIQVFPVTGQLFTTDVHPVLTRAEADNHALGWAASKFGISRDQVDEVTITHLSDSDTVGYLTKYNLMDSYDKLWSKSAPTDVYAAKLHLRGKADALMLYLHMETGDLVAWQHVNDSGPVGAGSEASAMEQGKLAAHALDYAAFWGLKPQDWEWTGNDPKTGSFKFVSRKPSIGASHLWLHVHVPEGFSALSSSFPPWIGGSVTYGVDLPASFTGYMRDQEKLSAKLSIFGFIVPQVVLFIIAIVYTGTHGSYSSYRRGIFLSLLFFALYAGLTFNMLPGLRAGSWETGASMADSVNVVISLVTYAAMAVLTYLSAVGGDGLWKSMGRSLWPRWRESGYGETVLRSMREGYILAFILLGTQSLVLLALEKSLGSFASSDASQSMYNMTYPLLLPLLAWCAGISEELQSRLLGIGVFRSWFVGGTRLLLRREPSRRAIIVLTLAAMIPPGLLWAMGHVGYAIYPVYTRIIELVLMSLLFGWFMLRFGIITVIFAHVTLDAILMGMQMMFDWLPGDFFGGVFSLVMPGLAGILIWWLHRAIKGRKKIARL
jgi:hypothetical protein